MEWRVGGVRIEVHPLTLLLPALALRLHCRTELLAVVTALCFHEAAHLIAARAMRVRVASLRLMPFGGAAQLGNIYALSPSQLFITAAAGPMANLLLLFICGALAQWGILSYEMARAVSRVNLALMLFNLLPALPLDGGRMLYALTARRLGRSRAASLGIALGRVAAAGLVAATARTIIMTGRFNLSLAACAVFILASAPEERRALADLRATSPLNALKEMQTPLDMRLCAVDAGCSALRALRWAAADAATLYAVYEGEHLQAFVDERAMLRAALGSAAATAGEAV